MADSNTTTALHPRSIWSPHRDSGCVQVCKSLLAMRGEDWRWVVRAEDARWIVIDASRPVDDMLAKLLSDSRCHRQGVALAKSWADVPGPHWAFFKLPLTPRGFFPWINQTLGLPPDSHLDKVLQVPELNKAATAQAMNWAGHRLRLRRWPNLTAYPGLSLRIVQVCRQMLVEDVLYEDLVRLVGDDPLLRRLLTDAWQQDNLRSLAPTSGVVAAASAMVASQAAQSSLAHRKEPSLFQRFLNRFR